MSRVDSQIGFQPRVPWRCGAGVGCLVKAPTGFLPKKTGIFVRQYSATVCGLTGPHRRLCDQIERLVLATPGVKSCSTVADSAC